LKWEKGIKFNHMEIVLTPEIAQKYADVSGDHNPLHLDETYARGTRFGTRIIHGMFMLAASVEILCNVFGRSWAKSGQLETSFISPAPIGSTLRIDGTITDVIDGEKGRKVLFDLVGTINNSKHVFESTGSVIISD